MGHKTKSIDTRPPSSFFRGYSTKKILPVTLLPVLDLEKTSIRTRSPTIFHYISSYMNTWCCIRMMHTYSIKFEWCHRADSAGLPVPKRFTTGLAPFLSSRCDILSTYFIQFKHFKNILIFRKANSFKLIWLTLSIFESH